MSTYDPDPDDAHGDLPGDEDPDVRVPNKDIRQLRERSKRTETAEANASRLERENAFLKAGIDVDSPAGKLLFNGYDGELTKDAIASAAGELGIATTSTPVPPSHPEQQAAHQQPATPAQPEVTPLQPGEANLTAERQQTAGGAPHDTGIAPDPYNEAVSLGKQVIADGGKELDGIGAAFNALARAAQDGDQRVIVPGRSKAALGDG